jgi:hypothetical protein
VVIMMTVLYWFIGLLMLAGFVVAARHVQTSPTVSGRVIAGVGGAFLGLMGILLIAALLFG